MQFKAAAIQLNSGPDKPRNLEQASRLILDAADQGAQLVVLPEVFNWRGPIGRQHEAAEDLEGPTLSAMAQLAADHKIYLVAGSITERIEGDRERAYNTSVLIGPLGERLGVYRKIHLFDVELVGRAVVRESASRRPGEQPVAVNTPIGTLGLSVCYDLRFPELYRALVSMGASILTVPSAFTYATGQAHWEILLRARAIENQCFVIAAGQYGDSGGGYLNYGNSLIVDAWGNVLARAGDDGEAVVIATLDFESLRKVRAEMPCLTHRRL